jgi:hypothetical protein
VVVFPEVCARRFQKASYLFEDDTVVFSGVACFFEDVTFWPGGLWAILEKLGDLRRLSWSSSSRCRRLGWARSGSEDAAAHVLGRTLRARWRALSTVPQTAANFSNYFWPGGQRAEGKGRRISKRGGRAPHAISSRRPTPSIAWSASRAPPSSARRAADAAHDLELVSDAEFLESERLDGQPSQPREPKSRELQLVLDPEYL